MVLHIGQQTAQDSVLEREETSVGGPTKAPLTACSFQSTAQWRGLHKDFSLFSKETKFTVQGDQGSEESAGDPQRVTCKLLPEYWSHACKEMIKTRGRSRQTIPRTHTGQDTVYVPSSRSVRLLTQETLNWVLRKALLQQWGQIRPRLKATQLG